MANAIIGALRVVLGMDTIAFEKGMNGAQKTLNKAAREWKASGEDLKNLGQTLTLAFTAPFAALAVTASKASTESAQAIGQVQAALKGMNGASGKTVEQLQNIAAGLQNMSVYDDDDILKSVTANLLTFGNISGGVFDRAEQSIVDISARLGQDLQSSTIQLGKALNDPIRGLTALSRIGIIFTADQENQIKAMMKHGEVAKAQGMILDEVAREFGGSAKAMREADPWSALRQAGNDFQEAFGGIIKKAIVPMVDGITKAVKAFNGMSPAMQSVIVGFAAVAAAVGPLVVILGTVITSTGTVFSTMASLAPMIAAVRTAWIGYTASVAALGPVQATAAAGATALGAAIDFALGPLGLAIGLIAAATAGTIALYKATYSATPATKDLAAATDSVTKATDAYTQMVTLAAGQTGKQREETLKNAAALKVEQQQTIRNAKAQMALNETKLAALKVEEARLNASWGANPTVGPMGASIGASGGQIANMGQQRVIRAQVEVSEKAIADANQKLKDAEAILTAGAGVTLPPVLAGVSEGAKGAKQAIDELRTALTGVMATLMTPDETADKAFKEQVEALRKARQAKLIDVKAYQEQLRRAQQARDDAYGIGKYSPADVLGDASDKEIGVGSFEKARMESAARIRDAYKAAWGEVGQAFKGAAQEWVYTGQLNWKRLTVDLLDNWKSVMSVLTDLWKNAQAGMQAPKAAGGSGGSGGIFDAISGILKGLPGHVNGTLSSPGGWHWVGERGPELLNMRSGAQVLNQSQLAAALGGGGSGGGFLKVEVDKSDLFDVHVSRVAEPVAQTYSQRAAVAGAQGGASLAGVNQADRERWRLK